MLIDYSVARGTGNVKSLEMLFRLPRGMVLTVNATHRKKIPTARNVAVGIAVCQKLLFSYFV